MTNKEFLNNIKELKNCPQNISEIYKEFSEYQKLALNTLVCFDEICRKNDITYTLAFGSLLGAIRDGGQIPWDYDVDVIVPINQRKKLIRALEKDLNSEYYYNCIEKNEQCRYFIMRLAPLGYDSGYIHVDVFFIMGLPENNAKGVKKKIQSLALQLKSKSFFIMDNLKINKRELVIMCFYKFVYLLKKREKIIAQYFELVNRYDLLQTKKCCLADRFSTWYDFQTDMFFSTIDYKVDNYIFKIPEAYDEILKMEYGNYLEYPSTDKQLEEMIVHYEFIVEHLKKKN